MIGVALLVGAVVWAVFVVEGVAEPQLIGVYSDVFCLFPLTSIDWGTLTPGDQVTVSCYVKNQGEGPMGAFSYEMQNVAPPLARNYLQLEGVPSTVDLAVGGVLKADLTLKVSPVIGGIEDFSFGVLVTGTFKELGGGGGGSGVQSTPTATAVISAEPADVTFAQFVFLVVVVVVACVLIGGVKKR